MDRYAFVFDINRKAMKKAGYTNSQITQLYQKHIPRALNAVGSQVHKQGSVYFIKTEAPFNNLVAQLRVALDAEAPAFRAFANRVHLFPAPPNCDITGSVTDHVAAQPMVV